MSKTDEEVIQAVQGAQKPPDNTVTLSTGVVLLCKQANPLTLIDVMSNFHRPKPPTFRSPQMGREMENPDDPEYRERLKAWQMEMSSATMTAMILLGTELESVPKKFPRPEDDAWLQEYELLGLDMKPDNPHWRYLKWVTFKAANNPADLQKIQDMVGRLSGVTERAVESAVSFPGSE